MAKINIRQGDFRRFERALRSGIIKNVANAFKRIEKDLMQEAERLRSMFANSPEFQALKSDDVIIGKFGFTPQQVGQLDRILTLLTPNVDNSITSLESKTQGGNKFVLLNWVDFESLKSHPFAQHPLTKLTPAGTFEVQQVVSWVDWLENGVSIFGYEFVRPTILALPFSRSKKGLMQQGQGTFVLQPTRVFERIGAESDIFRRFDKQSRQRLLFFLRKL